MNNNNDVTQLDILDSLDSLDSDDITQLNNALGNLNGDERRLQRDAIQFLNQFIFKSNVNFIHKRTALEKLLEKVPYHEIADKIALLIQETVDIYHKSDLIALTKRYRKVDPDAIPENPTELVEYSRALWKRGKLTKAIESFEKVITHNDATVLEKLTVIHTMVNDCYSSEQKEAVCKLLDPLYTFLQDTKISYASVRDILTSLFRIRNTNFQSKHNVVFRKHMDIWTSSTNTYISPSGPTFYVINKAWSWICDAIEFARPAGKETLWTYLTTWITEPPFSDDLPFRERCKYQFYACEFLLQSFRTAEQRTATEFLLNIVESDEYSTFVRGDALDVLLRHSTPREFDERVDNGRNLLRGVREDTQANMQMQAAELGLQAAAINAFMGGDAFDAAIAGTTYDDAQNVHATEINEAITDSLLSLSNDEEVRGNTIYKVTKDITTMIDADDQATPEQRSCAKAALSRYIEDPAVFTDKHLKLGSVLVLVWNRMTRHKEQSEMCSRLIQELSEAFNTCATGHLSRVVSVLSGYYSDIKQFASFEVQLENNIKARINAAIRKAPKDLQGDLLIGVADNKCPEYQTYLEFVADLYEPVHKELLGEFVPEYISQSTFDIIFLDTWPRK